MTSNLLAPKGDFTALTASMYLDHGNPFNNPQKSMSVVIPLAASDGNKKSDWINVNVQRWLASSIIRKLSMAKISDADLERTFFHIGKSVFIHHLRRSAMHRLGRDLTAHEKRRMPQLMNGLKSSLDSFISSMDREVLRYVLEVLPFKYFEDPFDFVKHSSKQAHKVWSMEKLSADQRALLALITGKMNRDSKQAMTLLGDMLEVLDDAALAALVGIGLLPWLVIKSMSTLAQAPYVTIEKGVELRYSVYKISQACVDKLNRSLPDSDTKLKEGLTGVSHRLNLTLGDSNASITNVMTRLNEKRTRNKFESIVLAKKDERLYNRKNQVLDVYVMNKELEKEVIAARRKFYLWVWTLLILMIVSVFMLVTKGAPLFVFMALMILGFTTLFLLINWYLSYRKRKNLS